MQIFRIFRESVIVLLIFLHMLSQALIWLDLCIDRRELGADCALDVGDRLLDIKQRFLIIKLYFLLKIERRYILEVRAFVDLRFLCRRLRDRDVMSMKVVLLGQIRGGERRGGLEAAGFGLRVLDLSTLLPYSPLVKMTVSSLLL